MILKLLIIIFLTSFSFASFQEVRIGKIDEYYSNKISKEQLRTIIDEIEYTFESQLNMNIFDYSNNGKDIDIIYVPLSKLEQRISKKTNKLSIKSKRIKKIEEYFYTQIEKIDILKSEFEYKNTLVNLKVEEFNNYIKEINNKKTISEEQYNRSTLYIKTKKKEVDLEIKNLKKDQRKLKRIINTYNQKNFSYKNLIKEYNRLSNEIESMSRSFKKVRGRTFGIKEITLNTSYKNGKKIEKQSINNTMDKIEIYGFESLRELKAVLAHELAHLVGVHHINEDNALMNPILQKNQIENLFLTIKDISNFNENF